MMGKICKSGAILAALALAGCSNEDTEGLARVARLSAAKVEEMTGGAPNKVAASFESMRANWNELALDARVSLRLRWEKDLQDTTIQVEAKDGTVELKGKVTNVLQRQRAVQVAQSTTGVQEVIDSLEVVSGDR
jgi:osmotically-inducible protein OsmY